MPPRKKPVATEPLPAVQIKLRVEPYFAVSRVDGPQHMKWLGATAREALQRAKNDLVHKNKFQDVSLLVVNGRVIEAISWSAPMYPDDADLLDRVLQLTGGILLE